MDELEKIGYKKEIIKDGLLYRRKPFLVCINKKNSTVNIINETLCVSGAVDFETIRAISVLISDEEKK